MQPNQRMRYVFIERLKFLWNSGEARIQRGIFFCLVFFDFCLFDCRQPSIWMDDRTDLTHTDSSHSSHVMQLHN